MRSGKTQLFKWIVLLLMSCSSYTAFCQLTADFSASPLSGCAPIRVLFTDQSSGSPTSWYWDLGNGTTSTQKNPSGTYFNAGTYTIKLTIYKGPDSSVTTKQSYVTVYANPIVDFDAGPKTGCYPLSVAFTDLASGGVGSTITDWQWDFGDGNISNLPTPTHIYTGTGLFNISLTITNDHGCKKTLTKPNLITINDGLKADFASSAPPTCVVPATVNFTNLSTGNNIKSYSWDFGDGGSSNLPNPSHTYLTAGIYTVKLTISNLSGCADVATRTNLIYIGIVTAAFITPDSICVNNRFGVNNVSSPYGSLTKCKWDFGDGTTDTLFRPFKSYNIPGSYTISLVADFGSCQGTTSKTINVLRKPITGFSGTNTASCKPPLTASLFNTSTDGTVVKWYFGDGDSSSVTNPVHTYTSNGSFTVTLIVRNASGCLDTLKKNSFVTIAPPKILSISPLPAEGCIPFTVNFDPVIQTKDSIVSYEWDLGYGVLSNLKNPSRTYTVEGTYAIKLKVTTAGGCTDTITIVKGVQAGRKPSSAFSATPLIACAMDEIHFTDNSGNSPDRWFWTFGDGGSSKEQDPIYNYNDTGYFTVRLIVWRSGCSDTLIKRKYIYIRPPIAGFLDSFVCSNQRQHFFSDKSLGALYWKYWFGDGDSSEIPSPSHLYGDTGRYIVRQQVRDSFCKHEASRMILVLDEKAGFNIVDSIGCRSTVKEFQAISRPWNILSYRWDFGDRISGIDSFLSNTIHHRYDSTGTYQVKLVITDLNSCPDSIIKPVSVSKYGPKADFGPFQNVCINSLVRFSDSSKTDGVNVLTQWIWDFGDSTGVKVFNAPPFTHTYTSGGLYTVRLITRDAAGCSDTLEKPDNVLVNDPKANFASTDTIKCRGTPVQFFQQLSGNNLSDIKWYFGDGDSSSGANPTHSYITDGTYDVKFIVWDNIGCTSSIVKPKFIKIYNAKASFSMSDSFTTCPPLFISFTNQSLNISQALWDFGDGNTSTLVNPSHTYTFSGIFNARLIVVGNGGCRDTAGAQVRLLGPSGTFSYSPLRGCTPMDVNFVSNTQNTYFYTWDYNDGVTNFGRDTATTHTYVRLGDFLPKIILEDSLGCKLPVLGIDTIKIKGVKSHIKSLLTYLICDSAFVAFTDSTVTNDTVQSYLWNFGDGFTSGQRNPVHKYAVTGVYNISLTVTTITGCISIDTLKVPIKIVPAPRIQTIGDANGCTPKTIRFTGVWLNQDTSIVKWKWNLGNGQNSVLQNPPDQTYITPAIYTIITIARNGSGCADTVYRTVEIFPLPVVDAGPGAFICRGQEQQLNATGASNYLWNPHPSLSCLTCNNPRAKPDSARWYQVEGTDSNGCKAIDTVLVKVKQPFLMRVNPGDTICVGQTVRLGAVGAERYRWTPNSFLNGTTIGNPVSRPDSTVRYMVVGYDTLGCFYDTGYVTIKVYPIPKVNIIEDRIQLVVGNSVQLHSRSSPDVNRWRWTPPLYLSCTDCENPIVTPRQEITYTLRVTNAGNCVAEDKVTIFLICSNNNVFVPNTFSPNGDGANDVFYPRGKGLFGVKSMRIFDRWGELLYEKTNFQPNDESAGWDGTYKGKLLTPDVYVYTMDVICDNNLIFNLKGNVTLLR
ncbi:MAG: PKD domain-containing protein [Chitinophagaceae bacterium]